MGWLGGAVLAVAGCGGQARPTYEYGPTETRTSTAIDPAPRETPAAAPAGEAARPVAPLPAPEQEAEGPAAPEASAARGEPAVPEEPTAPEEPAAPPPGSHPWYKAKSW